MTVQQSTYARPRASLGVAFQEYDTDGMECIATDVLPELEVQEESSTISVVTREGLLKRADPKRGSGGTYNRIDTETEDKDYTCKDYGLEGRLPDEKRKKFATDFDAEEVTVKTLHTKMAIEQEIRAAAAVFNTTTWDTGNAALYTDNSGSPWDNIATKIIAQVLAAVEKVRANTGVTPNALVLSKAQLVNILQNTEILSRFPGAAVITKKMLEGALASIFGLDKLVVGGQVYDSAKEGQAFVGSDVWSDDYAMVAKVAQKGDSMETPCIGRTCVWAPDAPEIITVEQYREEQTRSDVFRTRQYVTELICDAYFGHLMKVDA